MRSYSSREILEALYNDGWYMAKVTGDHWHLKHPTKPGKVTVPHTKKDLPRFASGNCKGYRKAGWNHT